MNKCKCEKCNGQGYISVCYFGVDCGGPDYRTVKETCPECDGTGYVQDRDMKIISTDTGRVDCSKPNYSNLPKTFGKTKLTKKQIGKRAGELKTLLKENYELLNALADGICYSGAEIPEELDFALYHLALAIDVLQDLRRNYR